MKWISRDGRRTSWRHAVGGLAGLALAGATLLASAPAAAANVTINTTNIKGGTTDTKRQSAYLYYISYADCLKNDWKIDVPISVTAGIGTLQLWAAETDNCASDVSRNGSGQCKQLPLVSSGTSIYTLNAKQLVEALGITDCADTSTSTAARTLTLYFILAGSTEDTAGTINADNVTTYPVKIDLIGPNAPTGLSLAPGDGILILNMPTNTDEDTQGYYVFADPNPSPPTDVSDTECLASGTGGGGGTGGTSTASSTSGAGGAGGLGGAGGAGTGGAATSSSSSSTSTTSSGADAGSGGTGGSGGAGGTDTGEGGASTACPAGTKLGCFDPVHPVIDSKFLYDSEVSRSSTQVVVKDLTNDNSYVIAVAGHDNVNNIGPLSVLQCGTPQPTNTFYNQYCADGGAACAGGCGSCTVGAETDLTWPGLGAAALAAAGIIVRRDRRRRKTSQQVGAVEAK